VRLDAAQAQSKTNHWRAVTVSACEQCGRNRLTQIETAQPLLDYLGKSVPGAGPRLVFEPESAPQPLPSADQGPTAAALNGAWAKVSVAEAHVAIGPEGGFTSDELEAFRVSGYSRGGLGPRVLRTETAAIAAVVWLQARYGDM
jgi:16S rRNA (uracil1498-N3)-methyltransferase